MLLGLVLLGCQGEPPQTEMVNYGFKFKSPRGRRFHQIEVARIGKGAKPVALPGCTATDPIPGWGTLTEHSCSVWLPSTVPGEFTVILTAGATEDNPYLPEQGFYFTQFHPALGTLDVYRDGAYAKLAYVSSAPTPAEGMRPPTYYHANVWDTASPCPSRFPSRDEDGICAFWSPAMSCGTVAIADMKDFVLDVGGLPVVTQPVGQADIFTKPGESLLAVFEFGAQSGPYCSSITEDSFGLRFEYPNDITVPGRQNLEVELRIMDRDYTAPLTPNGGGCSGTWCLKHFEAFGESNIDPEAKKYPVAVVCKNCRDVARDIEITTIFTGIVNYRVGLTDNYRAQLPPLVSKAIIR
jgi:hypothetical protein